MRCPPQRAARPLWAPCSLSLFRSRVRRCAGASSDGLFGRSGANATWQSEQTVKLGRYSNRIRDSTWARSLLQATQSAANRPPISDIPKARLWVVDVVCKGWKVAATGPSISAMVQLRSREDRLEPG